MSNTQEAARPQVKFTFERARNWGYIVRQDDVIAKDDILRPVQFECLSEASGYVLARNNGLNHREAWVYAILMARGA